MTTETEAAKSLKTTKIGDIVSKMQGMKHDDLSKLYDSLMAVPNALNANPDNAAKNKASVAMKPSAASVVKEDVEQLFGEDAAQLGEDFIENAKMLIESAVTIRVAELKEELMAEAEEKAAEQLAEEVKTLSETMDSYLNEAVTEWLEENKLAIESSVKTQQFESFMEGLRGLFEAHDIDIPEEKLDLVSELENQVAELKSDLNEAYNDKIEAERLLQNIVAEKIVEEVATGLPATQVEKLKTLAESVDFDNDPEAFEKKIKKLREAHFTSKGEEVLKEEVEEDAPVFVEEIGNRYAAAISRDMRGKKK